MNHRFICVMFLLLILPQSLWAEITPREAQRFGVDIVLLKGGVELRGAVLERNEQQLQLAVQRDWMRLRQPDLLGQIEQDEAQARAAAREMLIERTTTWQKERAADVRLRAALGAELKRLAKPAAAGMQESQFAIITLPAERVRRVFSASNPARQLAQVAWQQRLPKVEETTFGSLKTAVQKVSPQWQLVSVDLSDRFPTGQMQSDDEWAVRQAIYEYEFRQKLDFQGTGHLVFRVGEGAQPPDLNELFAGLAADTLQGELGGLGLEGLELEGLGLEGLGLDIDKDASPLRTDPAASKQTWQDRAVEQAQELDIRGFRVTRLPSITAMGSATVSVSFFARMPDNEYRIVWSDEVTTDPATVSPEDIKRVAQDPQVQQIMKFADALSVGQNANEALRFGAAVQLNLNEANTHFLEYIQRHTRSLDGSMIVIPSH